MFDPMWLTFYPTKLDRMRQALFYVILCNFVCVCFPFNSRILFSHWCKSTFQLFGNLCLVFLCRFFFTITSHHQQFSRLRFFSPFFSLTSSVSFSIFFCLLSLTPIELCRELQNHDHDEYFSLFANTLRIITDSMCIFRNVYVHIQQFFYFYFFIFCSLSLMRSMGGC